MGPISVSPQGQPEPVRYQPDDECPGVNVKFVLLGTDPPQEGYFTVSTYPDGRPARLFVTMGKEGHEVHGWADSWARMISLLFQYGVEPCRIYEKIKFADFEPNGLTNLPQVPFCKSVPDLIIRYLEANFPPTAQEPEDAYSSVIDNVVDHEIEE